MTREELAADPRNMVATPSAPGEVADRAVGFCSHVTVGHSHDWACAPCIAYWARRVMRPNDFISDEFKDAMMEMLEERYE